MAGALINSQADSELGPAMRACTPQMRSFVTAKIHYGMNDHDAAIHADVKQPDHHSWRIAHHPKVQAALLEEGQKLMRSQGPKSILTLVAIRDNPEAADRDRIKCATELLNRSGFHVVSEHHEHTHQHISESEADRRILTLAKELGLDEASAQKMLIAPDDFRMNSEGIYEIAPKPLSDTPQAVSKRKHRARRHGMTPEELTADKLAVQQERIEAMKERNAAGLTAPFKPWSDYDAARAALAAQGIHLPDDEAADEEPQS